MRHVLPQGGGGVAGGGGIPLGGGSANPEPGSFIQGPESILMLSTHSLHISVMLYNYITSCAHYLGKTPDLRNLRPNPEKNMPVNAKPLGPLHPETLSPYLNPNP